MNSDWLNIIRGMVRPVITVGLTALICYLAATGKIDAKEIVALYGPVLGFWFGQRKADGQG